MAIATRAAASQNTPGAMQAEIVKQEMAPIVRMIESDIVKSRIASVVPEHVKPDRLIRMALMSISKTPELRKCTIDSLILSICDAAALGLDCGGALGQAYLVPYKTTAVLIVGYRGLVSLARRSGQVSTVYAHVVRHGDDFRYELGLTPILEHRPRADIGATVTHAYAVCRFKDQAYQLDVMTRAEVDRIRKRSQAGDDGPWVTDFDEMAKKTVLRRLCKLLPLTPEAVDAIDKSEAHEIATFGDALTAATGGASAAIADTRARLGGAPGPGGAASVGEVIDPQTGEVLDPADEFEDERKRGTK